MNTLGAHEVLELHEVLNDAIHGLNTLQLYRPYAKDPQLQSMMNNHIQALTMEYNQLVQMAQQTGAEQALPLRGPKPMRAQNSFQPTYGLRNPMAQAPAQSSEEIDDVDVTVCILNCHKQSASLKLKAALEMADPALRQAVQAGANRSADMAYEGFQYANSKGYYQVPTLKDTTMNNFINSYGTTQMANAQQGGNYYM